MRWLFFFSFIAISLACNRPKKAEPASKAFDIVVVKKHMAEMNGSYGNRFTSNDTAFEIERYCNDVEGCGHEGAGRTDSTCLQAHGGEM
jgi:hypothetical protein